MSQVAVRVKYLPIDLRPPYLFDREKKEINLEGARYERKINSLLKKLKTPLIFNLPMLIIESDNFTLTLNPERWAVEVSE